MQTPVKDVTSVYDQTAKFEVSKNYNVGEHLQSQKLNIEQSHVPIENVTLVFKRLPQDKHEIGREGFAGSLVTSHKISLGNEFVSFQTSHEISLGNEYVKLYTLVKDILSDKFTVQKLVNFLKVHANPRGVFPGVDLFSATYFNPVTKTIDSNILSYSFLDLVDRDYVPCPPYYFYKRRCGASCSKYLKTFASKHHKWYQNHVTEFSTKEKVVVQYTLKPGETEVKGKRYVSVFALPIECVKVSGTKNESGIPEDMYYVNIATTLPELPDIFTEVFLDLVIMALDITSLPPPVTEDDYFRFCNVLNNMLVFDWWYLYLSSNEEVNVLDHLKSVSPVTFPEHVVNLLRVSSDECAGGFSGEVSTRFDVKSDLDRYRWELSKQWDTNYDDNVFDLETIRKNEETSWKGRAGADEVSFHLTTYYKLLLEKIKNASV